jgi:hypothetical protein
LSLNSSDGTSAEEFPYLGNYLDALEDEVHCVPEFEHEIAEIVDLYPAEMPRNVQIMSGILNGELVLQFNCLGDMLSQINVSGASVSVATVPHRAIETYYLRFLFVLNIRLRFNINKTFMPLLLETAILLSRFLLLDRVYHQRQIPQSISQFQMIDEVIGPGLHNSRFPCCSNLFMQMRFYILPLCQRTLIRPNRDPIVSKLRLAFIAMSLRRVMDTASLATVMRHMFMVPKVAPDLRCKSSGRFMKLLQGA